MKAIFEPTLSLTDPESVAVHGKPEAFLHYYHLSRGRTARYSGVT